MTTPVYSVDAIRAAEAGPLAAGEPLMERAAFALATHCIDLLGGVVGARIVVLVGSGNNGGDALFAGAYLARRGGHVELIQCGGEMHAAGLAAAIKAGCRISVDDHEISAIDNADLVIDGITGIGGRGPVREPAAALLPHVAESMAIVVACDIPSGVDADTGVAHDPCVSADVTVTFGALKAGLVIGEGRRKSGTVHRVDIGLSFAQQPVFELLNAGDSWSAPLEHDDYKYSRGVVAIAAGSVKYPGAALLAVGAARRTGVGMVRYVGGAADAIASAYPDVVNAGDDAFDSRTTGWLVGPGLVDVATGAAPEDIVLRILDSPVPVVLDAGALRALALSERIRDRIHARSQESLLTVLTPHDGEAAGLGFDPRDRDRIEVARSMASSLGALVVLKGPATMITSGERLLVDVSGTAALATAGSGDVLSGLVAGYLAASRGTWRTDALSIVGGAVLAHGEAGEAAAQRHAHVVAADLVEVLT